MRIVISHRQIDFDALASMFGVYKLYPDSVMVLEGKPNPYVQEFLALTKDLLPIKSIHEVTITNVDRIVLVDTHDISRASTIIKEMAGNPKIEIEIIDHHPYAGPLKPNMVIDSVGACATLIVEKIKEHGIPLNSFEATLLALGIYEDTGSLLFENTTARDVQAVAFLLEQGAQLHVIAEYLRKPLTEQQKELLQELVNNGQTYKIQGEEVYIASAISNEYIGGLALLAHRIGELERADTWFLIVQMDKRIFITGRSRNDGLPVNKVVAKFGGAGHRQAASASIKNGNLSDAIAELKDEIARHVKAPLTVRDVMTKTVHSVHPDTKLKEVEQLLLRYGHTGLPVIADGHLVGIISRRDVDKALKHGLGHAPVKGFMSTDVVTLEADAPWEEAQRLMVEHDIGRLPIVENGKVIGIISRSDILRIIHGRAVPMGSDLVRARSEANRQEILRLISKLPDDIQEILKASRAVCRELGCKAFVVGGFVRDLLLGVPTQDLDLVVEGEKSTSFAQVLIDCLGEGELLGHSRFGTARISFADGRHVDVAATRWEYYAYPGALPEVEESGLREDLFRRDFTINAMAIALDDDNFGRLVDYYGGLRDIRQKEIQFLHRLSFIDDPTRILRAVRFACRYDFSIAHETLKGIEIALKEGVLHNLSIERFSEELWLILKEDRYLEMFSMLVQLEVLRNWFGRDYPWNVEQAEIAKRQDLRIRFVYLLKNLSADDVHTILQRLTLTKELKNAVLRWLDLRQQLTKLINGNYSLVDIDGYLQKEPHWLIEVLALDSDLTAPLNDYYDRLRQIDSCLKGKDLIDLGVPQGPIIGQLLKTVRKAWLTGEISNRHEEMRYVKALISSLMNGG